MAAVTAAVAGIAGVGANVFGALKSSSAIGDAANAQIAATQQALQAQIQERQQITALATQSAQMSPSEINSINSILNTKGAALASTMQSINQQQTQLNAMDPNVKAAGQNLYNLLSGQAAATLAPLQKQQQMQRSQQMNALAQQLGPGFMSTSAGIEAMTKFDTQQSLALTQAQQSALGQITSTYLGLSGNQQQGQANITSGIGNAFAQSQAADTSVLSEYANVQNRLTNAQLEAVTAQPVNFQAPAGVAGNQFAGAQQFGQSVQGLGSGLGQTAGQLYNSNALINAFAGTQNTTTPNGTNLAAQVPSVAANFNPSQTENSGNTFSLGKL